MPDDALGDLERLHARVDEQAARLEVRHTDRLQCGRGCKDCCVDGVTVFDVEAERIRRAHPELLSSGTPNQEGGCAFLDGEGACRVYEDRPFVCRTQGLPLLWFEETEAGDITECRDICPLNAEGEPLHELPHAACWTLGPIELELQALQQRYGASQHRVPLRELFRRTTD